MTELTTNTPPARDSEAYRLAEELLRPKYRFLDALAPLAVVNEQYRKTVEKNNADKDAERAQLMALPLEELRNRRAQQVSQAAADEAARIEANRRRKLEQEQREAQLKAEKEAKKFYNQPSSAANCQHWATMDFWTFDEALALLMGKDPRVMTKAAMRKEIEPEFSLMLLSQPSPPKSDFVRRYEELRTVAERASDMKPAQLRPRNVLLWGHRSGAIEPPPELVKEVLARIQRTAPTENRPTGAPAPQDSAPVKPDSPQPTPAEASLRLKRAALVTKHERTWPSIEGDLRHANENGLSKTAKADGHGLWFEERALQWARQNGKLRDAMSNSTHAAHSPFGQVHKMDD